MIGNSGMIEGLMPIITNYPIAWTRFLLNTRILLATLPVSEFGTPPWDLEIWDATMRFRIKYAWTMAWSSFTPSVLFHYSRLCCRQSTTESGDLLLGCCSSYSLPVQLPAQTAKFRPQYIWSNCMLLRAQFFFRMYFVLVPFTTRSRGNV